MSNSLVQIRLHGRLGEEVGELWNLAVESVAEAVHAINVLGKQKMNKFLARPENQNSEFRVLINGEDFLTEKPLRDPNDLKAISETNLAVKYKNLKTIDILPNIEGSSGDLLNALQIILGVILIVIAIVGVIWFGMDPYTATMLITIGVGLIIGGVIGLLSKPPGIDDFRDIEGGKKVSYLFNGPENVTREGGPVPIGYGQLLVGSQVIAASYNTYDTVSEEGQPISAVQVNGGSSTENADATVPTQP